ncbi:transposase, partial [Endozoicomonas ascidiicola]
AKTVRRHRPLILNWFRAKKAYSSGIVEGLNTKIKLTTRKSYGFRTYRCAEIALYHAPMYGTKTPQARYSNA